MKVLIVGANGQLGTTLTEALNAGRTELGPLPAAYDGASVFSVDIDRLDITNLSAVRGFLYACKPDVAINCAAYTNVDGCESHRDEAFAANALGPRNLAIACEAVGARLVQLSTDYVFSGELSSPRAEYDVPAPQSVYGATKLAGEGYVRDFCTRWFIVRTAWLYGARGKNFVKTILRIAREKGALRVVNDQFGSPTYAEDLAFHILKIAATDAYGVYHCTGGGVCSWYDFAGRILSEARINAALTPCSTAEYGSQTKRPAYSALDHAMLRLTVGDEMRPWEDALHSFFTRFPSPEKE